MSANSRDNFKGTIIKFFLLALLAMFTVIGGMKQLFYGTNVLDRPGQSSAADGLGGQGR